MPKIVDHDERRQELIDALFRVIEAQGPHAVSTRSVASEAGVSKSNIGHYFESQAAMLSAAVLHELNARIEGDILAAVSALEGLGILRPGLDPTLEAKRLHALIDGLSLRTMTDPTALTMEEVRQIVRSHLAQITTLA